VAAGVIAAILLIAGIAALALSDGGERQRAENRQRPERTPTPEESPTATPTATTVDEALFALRVIVDNSTGLLPEDAAEKILAEADKANEEFLKGEIEKALEHLGKADAVIAEALAEGTTSEETAASLYGGVALVREAMQAQAIEATPEEELDEGGDEDNSGPGNSENAPGKAKKEDD
jgi:hypothetical protein